MDEIKKLTFHDFMQMSHDLDDLEKEFDMIMAVMGEEEVRTLLKRERKE